MLLGVHQHSAAQIDFGVEEVFERIQHHYSGEWAIPPIQGIAGSIVSNLSKIVSMNSSRSVKYLVDKMNSSGLLQQWLENLMNYV